MKPIVFFVCSLFFLFPHSTYAQSVRSLDAIYSFEMMETDLQRLSQELPIELVSIGKSEKGRELWAAKLGKGERSILLIGAHHGREWLTSKLLLKMVEEYGRVYKENRKMGKYSPQLLDEVSIWFVPMLNPDGVSIQQGNFSHFTFYEQMQLWQMNDYDQNWLRWKANAKGIDLNRQYPIGWEEVKTDRLQPSYQFYKGEKPLQASEVQALVQFTKKIKPLLALSYHTSGREIYWYYHNKRETYNRDYKLAQKTAQLTGYKLSMPKSHAVGSGFTDWFITEFHLPAMTIELSYLVEETNPPLSVFPGEWKRNQYVAIMLIDEIKSGIK